jgi:hypothetical protein
MDEFFLQTKAGRDPKSVLHAGAPISLVRFMAGKVGGSPFYVDNVKIMEAPGGR